MSSLETNISVSSLWTTRAVQHHRQRHSKLVTLNWKYQLLGLLLTHIQHVIFTMILYWRGIPLLKEVFAISRYKPRLHSLQGLGLGCSHGVFSRPIPIQLRGSADSQMHFWEAEFRLQVHIWSVEHRARFKLLL